MRLLILTQYYPPEIGAPQNRLHELAIRLQKSGLDVEVLTAMPNYPDMEIHETYRNGRIREEVIDGIQVYRSKIFVTKSKSILPRLLNYFSFVWTSFWRGRKLKQSYDYLMVESPPLFLGYSAMALARKLNAKLIFNVSDLWPESAEKMGLVNNKTMLDFAYKLEAKCYRKSWLITGQTQGIVDNIKHRFPQTKVAWLPNGVNLAYYDPSKVEAGNWKQSLGVPDTVKIFFYGGIIGHAQGLETILHAAQKVQNRTDAVFVLQGAGPVKTELQKLAQELSLNNVIFREPVPKEAMPAILKEVDCAIIPLRKLEIFEGAIPSKVFEALAMEIPLLLGVDGEARSHFVEKAKAALFCPPEDSQALADNILHLLDQPSSMKEMGKNGRTYVAENFNRDRIAQGLFDLLK